MDLPIENKWIRLSVKKSNDSRFVEFSVEDSGTGIPETIREKIFSPFFTTKEIGKGTGLGLSISKGIIEKHGGKIFIDKDSIHTKICFQLPIS